MKIEDIKKDTYYYFKNCYNNDYIFLAKKDGTMFYSFRYIPNSENFNVDSAYTIGNTKKNVESTLRVATYEENGWNSDIGESKDKILKVLGVDFYYKVSDMNYSIYFGNFNTANKNRRKAIKILKQIEERSFILINKIIANESN